MIVDYGTVKLVHQTTVALSLTGFFARGVGSLAGARWIRLVLRVFPSGDDWNYNSFFPVSEAFRGEDHG